MRGMSKAFTKEPDDSNDEPDDLPVLPQGNYMTPTGFKALQTELHTLMRDERPKVVEVVSWAAGNGDRSENGDYIYGKKRLREIDRRVRYLTKRIESATVVDPTQQKKRDQVFFGATVTYAREDGDKHTVKLVGPDEADLTKGLMSWLSPVARALMRAQVGAIVELTTPAGPTSLEVLSISYSDEKAS
jgi:transcription elongation factor GreB